MTLTYTLFCNNFDSALQGSVHTYIRWSG